MPARSEVTEVTGDRRRRAGLGRAARAVAAVVVLLAMAPRLALAHAYLERANPPAGAQVAQSPAELRLDFSEPLNPNFSRVQLLDSRREAVDRGDSHVLPDDPRAMVVSVAPGLAEGIYTVAWRTLSEVDGHTVSGAYPLIVGNPSAEALAAAGATNQSSAQSPFSAEAAVARWWLYLAASLVLGGLVAWRVVFAPLTSGPNASSRPVVHARMRRLLLLGAVALVVGTLYAGVAQAASAAEVPLWRAVGAPLVETLGHGRYAAVWWPRLALGLLVLGLIAWRGVEGTVGDVALAATPAILLTSSLTSHGAALVSGAYLGIAADWLHFLAVAVWIGGLATLVVVLPTLLSASGRATSAAGRGLPDRVLARAVTRFSAAGLASVAAIIATGTFQAWLEVGSWDGLLTTGYGHSILAKIGLMALMLVLAAFNLLVAGPRLVALSGASGGWTTPWASRLKVPGGPLDSRGDGATAAMGAMGALARGFRRAVRGELVLGVLVLAVAALLTGLAPARQEVAARESGETNGGPVDRQVQSQGITARVRITPAQVGLNQFSVDLPGVDPASLERVQLTLTFLDADLGSQPLVLQSAGPGQATLWQASSPLLSQPGQWQADLLARRTGQDDIRGSLRLRVLGPGATATDVSTAGAGFPLLPSPPVVLSYLLVAAGLVVAASGLLRRGRRRRQARAAVLAAGLLVVACGGYVYAREQREGTPLDVANVRDPVPPDDRSLASGRQTYEALCATCHGDTGRGDGPTGLRLVPRPADLQVHMAPGVHSDGQLFYWVSYGVAGTAMPAWKDTLTEEQRWDVINYARTLVPTR